MDLHNLSKSEVAKKKQILVRGGGQYGCICNFMKRYILLSILMLCGCSGGKAGEGKTQPEPVAETTENVQADNSPADVDSAPAIRQDVNKEKKTVIDTTKIYNMGEVDTPAVSLMSDKELMEYLTSRFKYPDIEPVTGRGVAQLTIERDGSISDVKIVQGIHPELDKEYERVLRLFPKFKAATIDGVPVRSILEFPILAKAM